MHSTSKRKYRPNKFFLSDFSILIHLLLYVACSRVICTQYLTNDLLLHLQRNLKFDAFISYSISCQRQVFNYVIPALCLFS